MDIKALRDREQLIGNEINIKIKEVIRSVLHKHFDKDLDDICEYEITMFCNEYKLPAERLEEDLLCEKSISTNPTEIPLDVQRRYLDNQIMRIKASIRKIMSTLQYLEEPTDEFELLSKKQDELIHYMKERLKLGKHISYEN